MKVNLKKIILEEDMFWKNENGSKQLIKSNNKDGELSYYLSYDSWDNITIFIAEICLISLNIEVIAKEDKLFLFNQKDFFI